MPKENYLKIETTEATYFPELVGTANRMSDAKGQFIQVDRRLFGRADQLSSGCAIDSKIAVVNISGAFPIDEIRKTAESAVKATSFGFDNKPDQIIEAFKVQKGMIDAGAVVSSPKYLVFPVNGDISPLDIICSSPAIKAVRAKAAVQK